VYVNSVNGPSIAILNSAANTEQQLGKNRRTLDPSFPSGLQKRLPTDRYASKHSLARPTAVGGTLGGTQNGMRESAALWDFTAIFAGPILRQFVQRSLKAQCRRAFCGEPVDPGHAISRDVWLSGRFSPNLMTPGFSTLL
jgi:hypothetical protein